MRLHSDQIETHPTRYVRVALYTSTETNDVLVILTFGCFMYGRHRVSSYEILVLVKRADLVISRENSRCEYSRADPNSEELKR